MSNTATKTTTMSIKFHPDKMASSSEREKEQAQKKFLEVQTAHDVLSDALKRRTYDAERSRSRGGFGFGGLGRGFGGGGSGFGHEDDLFSAFYARNNPDSRRR